MKRFAVALIPLLILALAPTAWAQKGRRPSSAPGAKTEEGPAGKAKEAKEPKAEPVRQTLTDPAVWAPADALVYLGINDIADTWQDIQSTSAYSLLSEPAGAAALPGPNMFGGFVGELKARLAKALDVPPDRLQNPLAGPVAFFITAPFGAQAEEIEPGLVAGIGDAALAKTYYDAAITKLTARGKHTTVSAGSDTIDVFTFEREKKSGDAVEEKEFARLDAGQGGGEMLKQSLSRLLAGETLPPKLALCLTADRVIVAGAAEYVQSILRQDESIETVAGSDDYKALIQNLKPVGDTRFVVNLPRIIEMIPAAAPAAEAKELRKKIKAWGLGGLGSLVGQCRLGAASYESKVEALLLLGANRTGLVKLLDAENQPAAPPTSIGPDTCAWATWNVDVPQWLDASESGISQPTESAGAGAGRSWMERPLPDGGTINLRRAFFDYLRGPLTLSFAIGQAAGVRILVTLGHSDQAAVTKFLTGPLAQTYLQAREAGGEQVFDVAPLPFLPAPGLALAVTADRLILGNTAAVEGALAPSTNGAPAEGDAWKHVARYVPEQAWFTLFVDNRKLLDNLSELAKKPPPPPAGGPDLGTIILATMLQGLGSSGDAAALDRLRRYAAQAAYTITTTPQGVEFTAVQLRPEK